MSFLLPTAPIAVKTELMGCLRSAPTLFAREPNSETTAHKAIDDKLVSAATVTLN